MKIPFLNPDMQDELNLRLSKISETMHRKGVDAVLIGSTTNIYYLSGCVYRGYVWYQSGREPLFLMVPPSVPEAGSPALALRKPEMIPDLLAEHGYGIPSSVGLEFDDLFYSEVERLKSVFPDATFANASTLLREARMVKTDYEIGKMKEDGIHHVRVYSRIEKCYQEDMTDLEFQIEIERLLRREGCLGYLRAAGSRMEINMGSVICGDNADVPSPYDFSMGGQGTDPSLPVGANGVTMRHGTTVMVDMNGGFNGYQTDMTRVWSIGEPSDLAKKAHACSIRILRELETLGHAGIPVSDLYIRAVEIAHEEGLHDYFMGHRNKVRFIGHGIGIELNEMPVVMDRDHRLLETNMTIALEPKFVIPHVGAVGVENSYRVTETGLENLTPFDEEMHDLRK